MSFSFICLSYHAIPTSPSHRETVALNLYLQINYHAPDSQTPSGPAIRSAPEIFCLITVKTISGAAPPDVTRGEVLRVRFMLLNGTIILMENTAGLQKILVVEDDAFISDMYQIHLAKSGYTVAVAVDGLEALETVKTFQPDLILLDIMMPKMDGIEVLKILRGDPTYGCTTCRIVMLTNLGDNTIAERLKDMIDGFAIKADITLDDLLVMVRAFDKPVQPQSYPQPTPQVTTSEAVPEEA